MGVARMLADLSDFGLLGEQRSQKCSVVQSKVFHYCEYKQFKH